MGDSISATPFRRQVRETGRLIRLGVRLTWRASPGLVLGILLLLALQALLRPVQLVLSRVVVDRVALDLGAVTRPDVLATALPLSAWIALTVTALAVSQLAQPFVTVFQAVVADRLTGYVTRQLIVAANRCQGLARLEDPGFADDLERARSHAATGGLNLLMYGGRTALDAFSAAGFALLLVGLHPLAPLVLLLANLPQMTRQWEYQRQTSIHLYRRTPAARRLAYYRDLFLTPEPAKDVRLYGLGPFFRRRYDATYTPILAELDDIRRRLVGHNGAGKTTIVKLLLRLYDPTAGAITLDGVDLRDYDPADLRREVGAIFQDFVRYELTAGENIAMGQVDALEHPAQLLEAATKAGAAELLGRLPQGLDTPLGRELGGRELSGGEWQKLALARAFLRDAQLLVLDEPTAALDVQTEHDVYSRFHDLTRDRTTVLISHRFSTVRMADRILYLADGAIQEEGSHAELMAKDGDYARLYRLQAAAYIGQEAEVSK